MKSSGQTDLRGHWKQALIGGAVVIAALLIVAPFTPGGRQMINMRRARQHIAELTEQLASDGRFNGIEFAADTSRGGSLAIGGVVPDEKAFDDLKRIVADSHPPVELHWVVTTRKASP